jgi:N4-gp56 family major capsid protein
MAEVALASASEKQKWLSKAYMEYVRASGFMPYMGKSSDAIINVKYELQEEAGKTINIPLITRLKNGGVTGSGIMEGNEEALGNFNCAVSIDWRRNAVKIPKSTSYKTEIDLWGAAKDMLKTWEAEKLRDDLARAMLSVELGVNYENSSAATRNAWLVANADRVLYGQVKSNAVSGVHATALALVDTTNDKLTVATALLAKRMAKNANPHIRPFKIEDGREFFVMFIGSRAMRDLTQDTTMINANRDARARESGGMNNNPLFQDGDLLYNGVIFREVPEIDDIASASGYDGVGAASADVRPCFLCGAQALAIAWGQEPTYRTDTKADYEFRPGVAIEELLGVRKLFFGSGTLGNFTVQHGMVTLFVAAAADS